MIKHAKNSGEPIGYRGEVPVEWQPTRTIKGGFSEESSQLAKRETAEKVDNIEKLRFSKALGEGARWSKTRNSNGGGGDDDQNTN